MQKIFLGKLATKLLIFISGVGCIVLAILITVMDFYFPSATASFFNIDILADFEDVIIVKAKEEVGEASNTASETSDSSTHELKPVENNGNGQSDNQEEDYGNVEVK